MGSFKFIECEGTGLWRITFKQGTCQLIIEAANMVAAQVEFALITNEQFKIEKTELLADNL